jgi:hypothetical protein
MRFRTPDEKYDERLVTMATVIFVGVLFLASGIPSIPARSLYLTCS